MSSISFQSASMIGTPCCRQTLQRAFSGSNVLAVITAMRSLRSQCITEWLEDEPDGSRQRARRVFDDHRVGDVIDERFVAVDFADQPELAQVAADVAGGGVGPGWHVGA